MEYENRVGSIPFYRIFLKKVKFRPLDLKKIKFWAVNHWAALSSLLLVSSMVIGSLPSLTGLLARPVSRPRPRSQLVSSSSSTVRSLQREEVGSESLRCVARITEMDIGGLDSDGREFKSADEMWREQVGDDQKKSEWYQNGVGYWQGVEASVDGVLGGYGHVSEPDVTTSEAFLKTLFSERFEGGERNRHLVALDCGSGIGRVTKNLLIRHFNEVDLLEPVSHFLEAARESLVPGNTDTHKATNFFCVPLQEFTPEAGKYDVIWIQWCIGHLADDDFVSFFNRAKVGLKPDGFFVLKENLARSGFVLDKEDRSITRSDLYFKELFRKCGLHLYKSKDQKGFPDELFAVKMYALTTEVPKPKRVHGTRSKKHANTPGLIK